MVVSSRRIYKVPKRSRVAIFLNILKESGDWIGKTKIIHKASLNSNQAKRYLGVLVDAGLMVTKPVDMKPKKTQYRGRPSKPKMLYKSSDEGRNFLNHMKERENVLEELEEAWRKSYEVSK